MSNKDTRRMRRLNKVRKALHKAKLTYAKAEQSFQRAYWRYVETFAKEWD